MGKLAILELHQNNEGFQVILEVGQGGSRPHTMVKGQLPRPQDLLQNYQRWQAAYYQMGQSHRVIRPIGITLEGMLTTRRKNCMDLAEVLQSTFNQWLRVTSFQSIREALLRELQVSGSVRMIVQSDEMAIFKLPWQQWDLLEGQGSLEIGFSALEYTYPSLSSTPTPHSSIKILAILGHAKGIDVEQDRSLLEQLPRAEVTFLVEPTRQDLGETLWKQHWDVLFFAGHSATEADRGHIYLNPSDRLSLRELKATLSQAAKRGLQLAIFNSCDGLGLAQELKALGIPQIVVMREPVPDPVAQAFLKYFLQAFSEGKSLDLAVRQGREQLEGLEDQFPCASWLPVLMQHPAAPLFSWPVDVSLQSPASEDERIPARKQLVGWRRLALVPALVAAGVTTIRLLGGLQSLELGGFDLFMRFRPHEAPDPRLLLVEVTEDNLRQYGEATLSDQMLARGLQILESQGARVIGIDIFRDLPQEPGRTELIQQLQSDRTFIICQHPEAGVDPGTPPPAGVAPEQLGFSDVVVDSDGVVRRYLFSMEPVDRTACKTTYALSLLVAGKYLESEGISESGSAADALQFGDVILKGMDAPAGGYQRTDLGAYQILLNYRRDSDSINQLAQSVTFDELIAGQIDPTAIANHIVLIGITAQSRKDEFRTPYGENIQGLALHAQMVSQTVSAVLDGRSLLWTWHWSGDVAWILAWSGMGALTTVWCSRPRWVWIANVGLVLLLTGVCVFAFQGSGLWLAWIPAAIGSVSTAVLCRYFLNTPLEYLP